MSLSDPIADMLTRLRNAARIQSRHVNIKASKRCSAIASVLKAEGYIDDFEYVENPPQGLLRVSLKYDSYGNNAFDVIKRISRPGRRVYAKHDDVPVVMNGMGIAIVSTSKGLMSDKDCRKANIGGEVICTVC